MYLHPSEIIKGEKILSIFSDPSSREKRKLWIIIWILCIQEGTRDIQSAVKFRMSYTLVQDEPRSPRDGGPLPNINQYPILNQQEASKIFQATFEKDCGDNDVCESNMVTVANLDLPQGNWSTSSSSR